VREIDGEDVVELMMNEMECRITVL
jgi:hypothetical protein